MTNATQSFMSFQGGSYPDAMLMLMGGNGKGRKVSKVHKIKGVWLGKVQTQLEIFLHFFLLQS